MADRVGATGATGERGPTGAPGHRGLTGRQGVPGPESRSEEEWEAFRQIARHSARHAILAVVGVLIVVQVIVGYVFVSLMDHHVENCGPGARLTSKTVSNLCDLIVPWHSHNPEDQ